MNRPWLVPAIVGVVVLLLICCLCAIVFAGTGAIFFWNVQSTQQGGEVFQPEITEFPGDLPATRIPTHEPAQPRLPSPTPDGDGQQIPEPVVTPVVDAEPEALAETIKTLGETNIPLNDAADLARRLQGKINIPLTLEPPTVFPEVGDEKTFWVSNTDTNESFMVDAVLRDITDHAYFWIEQDVRYRDRDLQRLADAFENEIYPTNREFFGSEWTPGVDGDPHLYILYVSGVGDGIAGLFSSADSINPAIQKYSNGHELFIFNADSVTLDEEFTYGVLAHEFQHMIHWYRDRNEATWLNEGFSDLAMFLNGYDIGGHDYLYALDPDIQLNDWPNDSSLTTPHYGASFLFVTYFLDRFGEQATQAVVGHADNGMDSIDKVLSDLNISDALRGSLASADDVFSDWVLASYLQDDKLADGRYTYHNYSSAPEPSETDTIFDCAGEPFNSTVNQYGVDYISLQCNGDVTLRFEGNRQVGVMPSDPFSGAYAFWSNKGDESDMTLTQAFDFTSASGPLTLTYWTWYDIEEDFDYVYLLASEDGENWQMLDTPSGTDYNPVGSNYGWGYTGLSDGGPGWMQESIDLSQFAGKKIDLRFEYITDAAVNGEGMWLDDIAIPEIGYFTDFEADNGGWEPSGFARIQNAMPQTYRVSLITRDRQTSVQYLQLSPDNTLEIPLSFQGALDEVVLVISGTNRYTRQTASYSLTFLP
jgi:immune inhibitor A